MNSIHFGGAAVVRHRSVLIGLAFAWVLGCGSKSESVSGTVGPNGAVLVGRGGTSLSVPPGALASEVTVTIASVGRPVLPPGTLAVSRVVRLTPATQTFSLAVDVTIPVSSLPAGRALSEVWVIRGDADTGVFVPLPAAPASSGSVAMVAQTDTLGDFVAVVPTASGANPFAPCGDAVCSGGTETCSTCPFDCGLCLTPPGDGGTPICEVGAVTFAGTYPRTVTLSGSLLLGASDLATTDAFQVMDVTTPSAPTLVGSLNLLSASLRQVAVRGSLAFVTDGVRIAIIDVSVPATPVEVGSYDLSTDTVLTTALNAAGTLEPYGIAIAGNYAYVPTSDRGFVVFDVSAAPTITRVGYATDGSLSAGFAVVAGSRVYFTSYESQICIPGPCATPDLRGILVYDVTTPASPTKLGVYSAANLSASDVAVSGTTLYVSNRNTELLPLDATNPASIVSLGGIATNGYAYGVAVSGSLLFVASNSTEQHLQIYSLTNPAAPSRLVDQIVAPSGGAWDVVTDGTHAYVAGTGKMTIVHSSCR